MKHAHDGLKGLGLGRADGKVCLGRRGRDAEDPCHTMWETGDGPRSKGSQEGSNNPDEIGSDETKGGWT